MIPKYLLNQITRLLGSFPQVQRGIIFGSRARGDAEERSDIDLAIEAPNINQRQWLELVFHIEEETDTLLSFDIVRFEEACAELRDKITKEGEVIYERNKGQAKYGKPGESSSEIR